MGYDNLGRKTSLRDPDMGEWRYEYDPNGNLALGKPATADSSCDASEAAAKAVDGQDGTKWCSGGATKWLQVDLGGATSVGKVVLKHAGVNGNPNWNTKDFTLQVSTDGATYTTVATVTGNSANESTHTFAATPARYVRLTVTVPTQDGNAAARIHELEVYAPAAAADERYSYTADGARVTRQVNGVTTVYLAGLWEEDVTSGGVRNASRAHYRFHGQVIAQRTTGPTVTPVVYLHGDHLGSVALATDGAGNVVSRQDFTPWGEVRSGGIGETTLNYTGQRKDSTGLLYYHARYYDPAIGRFISADSIVPGTADGKGGSAATLGYDKRVKLTPLTVDFHEPHFVSEGNNENRFTLQKGFWFQLTNRERQEAKYPWGPQNPQALNRYAYVLNNPLRYSDPTGHNWAVQALYLAFEAAGMVVSAALLAEIALAFSVAMVVACLTDDACRDWAVDIFNTSYRYFVDLG